MANGVTQDKGNWDRAHSDINVVSQRVTAIESALVGLGDQLRDIRNRLDTKPTDIWKIISGVVALLALIGAFLYQGKAYIDATLERHDREIGHITESALARGDFHAETDLQQRRNLSMDAANAKIADELVRAEKELAALDSASTQRYAEYLKNETTLQSRVDSIDANLIKRPEIESIVAGLSERINATASSQNDRTNSVIGSMNELRHDVGANFTLGDALKSTLDRLDKIQAQINTLAQTPGREAPVAK